jgi:D-aspartate ligase
MKARSSLSLPDAPQTPPSLPPPRGFVLTMGDFLGTLAAARDLGRHGIPVVLADAQPDTLTANSRYVTRSVSCPGLDTPDAWVRWLLEFGRREPGYVLYGTSDKVCWLLDQHHDALRRFFYLYQPEPGRLYGIMNKKRLHARCEALGIDQPAQWTPEQALSDPAALAYPVLVKPKTHAGTRFVPKGVLAASPAELRAVIEQFGQKFSYSTEMLAQDPALAEVMVQAFHPEAAEHIYSLCGFYAPEEDIYLLRACQKVLQHPLRIGLGLCFESRPVQQDLARQLRRLMDVLGYRGAFEVEFIHLAAENRFLLIDFNTRFYGQMGFEIARGLPVPRLCYLAAVGDSAGLRQLAVEAQAFDGQARWCFRNAWMLKLFVTTHWLGGNLTRRERREWLDWARNSPCDDPVFAADDPAPARIFRRQTLNELLRHPRSTLRRFFRR